MIYTPSIEGFEGQKVEAKISLLTGSRLFINGTPAPKGLRRGEMVLQRNDGRPVYASWKPQAFGLDVPQLVVDGRTISLAAPLQWYQWVWSALPVLLVFWGGLLGAIAGVLAFSINTSIFRSSMNQIIKYFLSGLVSILTVLIYLVIGSVLYLLITG